MNDAHGVYCESCIIIYFGPLEYTNNKGSIVARFGIC